MNDDAPTTHLVLMGLRACGKSTLARAIAERAGVVARDLDPMVLERMGVSTVREAWERDGEAAFRHAETEALREAIAAEPPSVLALGGGTPTAPGADDVLREAVRDGVITLVYLRLSPEALRERMHADDPDRPSLTGGDALDEIARVFEVRDPLYRALAEFEHAPECSVERDASKLMALWASG